VTGRLVLATRNPAKLAELRRILEAGRVPVGVSDLGEYPGMPAVADDSGLCVDALNGMPGVLSARWSGKHGDDEANLWLVLGQMSDVPAGRRGAHFTCAAALVLPSGAEQVTEGVLEGSLTREPRGSNGFGYDPIFVPSGRELTTAQLSAEEKDKISHRGRALRALAPVIAALLS
jgi:XTP/dITP diphosphohydrolase